MFELLSFSLALLIIGLGFPFLLLRYFTKQKPVDLPHGDMGWPVLGKTLGFLKPHRSNSVGEFLQEHCSRHGKVFKSNLFGSPTIVSCDHELNTFVLQNEERLFRASYPKPLHGILGNFSLLIVSGDLHKKLRNIAVSFIGASKSTPDFLRFVEKLSVSMMDSWKGCREIRFCKEIRKFTLNLMVKHLLSIEPEEPLALKFLEDFLTYMKGFVSLPVYIPGTPYANAVKARKRLSSAVRDIIKEREQKDSKWTANGDFLDVILSNRSLSDEEIVSIVLDILLGGYETTATLIPLAVYFLAHSPDSLEKLREEHRAIRKSKKDGEPLTWEDYQKMEFTSYVVCEAMRCGNVVKFVHRKAIQDVKFKGFHIPCGWKILPVLSAVHFDPSLHENPMEFNPWRWTDKATGKKVMPFGGGPRLCPGAELAKVEIAFFLHHLVLNYRWKTKADDIPLAYPYVEFTRGLLLEIEAAADHQDPIDKSFLNCT